MPSRWMFLLPVLLSLSTPPPCRGGSPEPRLWLARPYWTHALAASIRQTVALDLEGDGWTEIAVVTAEPRLSILDLAGRVRWSQPLPTNDVLLVPGDLDGRRGDELLLRLRGSSDTLTALDGSGRELWRKPLSGNIGGLALLPFDGARAAAIMVGLSNPVPSPALLLDARTGETRWSFQPEGAVSAVAVGELGQPGQEVVLLGSETLGPSGGEVAVYALGVEGDLLWVSDPLRAGAYHGSVEHVQVVDLGPGRREILVAATGLQASAWLCLYSAAGRQRWCRALESASGELRAARSVRVFPRAGSALIVVATDSLQAFDLDGNLLWSHQEGRPSFVARQLLDVDGDRRGEILAVTEERWTDLIHVLAIAGNGRLVRQWSYPGLGHEAHELSLPDGPALVGGAGQLGFLLTRHGLQAFSSTVPRSFAMAGDWNRDGFAEALLADGPALSLFGLPALEPPAAPYRVWQAEVEIRSPPALAASAPGGWTAIGGPLQALFADGFALGSNLRLVSPWGEVVWSRRQRGRVNGIWLGPPPRGEEAPTVYTAASSSEVPPSSPFFPLTGTGGELLALGGEGDLLWRATLPGSPAALAGLADGVGGLRQLIVGLAGDPQEALHGVAVYEPTGRRIWQRKTPGPVLHVQAAGEGFVAAGVVRGQGGGFLLRLRADGRLVWERRIAAWPVALLATDLTGDRRPEILAGLLAGDEPSWQCFGPGGEPLWALRIHGRPVAVAAGDPDGDGRNEAVVATQGNQVHVVDGAGRVALAVKLPGFPAVVAVSPGLPGRPGKIFAALQTEGGTARLLALDPSGRIAWSHELEGTPASLFPWSGQGGPDGLLYATAEGRFGLLGPSYAPPPLLAVPELRLEEGDLAGLIEPAGRPVQVTLEIWRQRQNAWEGLGTHEIGPEGTARVRWAVQPFGLRDLGKPARFRFRLHDSAYPAVVTAPFEAASQLPMRWAYLQRSALWALGALAVLAAPAGIVLFRRWRLRGPHYRDVVLQATASPEAHEVQVELSAGARSRSYGRSLAAEETARRQIEHLEDGCDESVVRSLRDLLQLLLLDEAARKTVFHPRVRTRLRLDLIRASRLADLPWELLLLDEPSKEPLLHDNISLLRFVPAGEPRPVIPVLRPPLRLLVVKAVTKDGPPLDADGEEKSLESALAELLQKGMVELRSIGGEDAQIERIGPVLASGYDIVHFIGHGSVKDGSVYFAFPDKYGDADRIEAGRLGEIFLRSDRTARVPWLVFLGHCHSATSPLAWPTSTPGLLGPRRALAFVGMQQEIHDDAARTFATTFYRALLTSGRIDHAALLGRRAILGLLEGERQLMHLDWMRPAVYTCVKNGRLFEWG